jgi:hypothetical protein
VSAEAAAIIRFRWWPALTICAVYALLLPLLARGLPHWSEWAVLSVLALFTVMLALADWQQRVHSRRFFVRHHVRPDSRWFGLLRGGWLMLPWSLFKALLLSLALLAGLMSGGLAMMLMLLSPLLVYYIRDRLWVWLQQTIVEDYLVLLSERLARRLTLLLMLAAYLLVSLYQPQPDLVGTDFADVAREALNSAVAESQLVTGLRAVVALQEVSFSWPLQNLIDGIESRLLWLFGWAAILLKGTLAFLPVINLALMVQRVRGAE